MIGWLSGDVVTRVGDHELIVNVNGVGYHVHVPVATFASVSVGDALEVHVHTHVRDDAIILFGFENDQERATFLLLLATPGIGPSTALAAISTMSPEQLSRAVAAEDVDQLAKIPGIGKKTAARMILELNGKLPNLETQSDQKKSMVDVTTDVSHALRQLGYSVSEIREALADVALPDDDASALRVALQQLGRR